MSGATFATLGTILGPRMTWDFEKNLIGSSATFDWNSQKVARPDQIFSKSQVILEPRIIPRVAKVAPDIGLTDYQRKKVL